MTPLELIVCDDKDQVYKEIIKRLKKSFCPNGKLEDCFCSSCRKVEGFSHPNSVLIDPAGFYSVKDIEVIFQKVSFALQEEENFFFILMDVHNLNTACANRLLKILEEPPRGYHFILSTNNLAQVIPTIVSRCVLGRIESKELKVVHPLLILFSQNKYDAIKFESILRETAVSDEQSSSLLNHLYAHYVSILKDIYLKSEQELDKSGKKEIEDLNEKIVFLEYFMKYLPHSGSANLFWRNLYMHFPRSV